MMKKGNILKHVFCFFLILCSISALAQAGNSYDTELENWKQKRIAALKAPNGWLNLTGLFWLKPGKNSFGSDPSSDIVYPDSSFPAHAGVFELNGNTVSWSTAHGTVISVKGNAFPAGVIFQPGNDPAPQLATGRFRWNIIKREDRYGVRFRDLESHDLLAFPGIERFPTDTTWRFPAKLEAASKNIFITNILGQTNAQQSPGKLLFTINGQRYSLDALDEGGEDLFIVFGDATSGEETYPSGRFLYVKKPDASGNTVIDFNKAINPPCAFTTYATCPLPPSQNILPVRVPAGEKNFGHH